MRHMTAGRLLFFGRCTGRPGGLSVRHGLSTHTRGLGRTSLSYNTLAGGTAAARAAGSENHTLVSSGIVNASSDLHAAASGKVWQRQNHVCPGHYAELMSDDAGHTEPLVTKAPPQPEDAYGGALRPYSSHSTVRLMRGVLVTELCRFPLVMKNAQSILDLSYAYFGSMITNFVLQKTLYGYFCGGVRHKDAVQLAMKLKRRGLGTILDYAAEASHTEVTTDTNTFTRQPEDDVYYETNLALLRESIISCAATDDVGFAALKVTSLVSTGFLRRLSSVVHGQETAGLSLSHRSTDDDVRSRLDEEDIPILDNITRRLDYLCGKAARAGARVLVDAEDTSIQPAIDFLVLQCIGKHNVQQPTVYHTYQMYLKDSLDRLEKDKKHVEQRGNVFAAKLVRGAYMEMERERAAKEGKESPVHDSFAATSASYNAGIDVMLRTIESSSVMVASHNEGSVQLTIDKMTEAGVDKPKEVFFAQLLGMKDTLSLGTIDKGYHVFKYVPYGPIEEVIPYLLRRSQENSQMAEVDESTRSEMRSELIGRFFGTRRHIPAV